MHYVQRRKFSVAHSARLKPVHLASWLRDNATSFLPPVMNKLMHRHQLNVMFVAGPNQRTDFHLQEGSEFFFQLRGNMQLPIVHAGRRELVHIREGDVFLLPSRIPHSPQRPEHNSVGLVMERQRYMSEPPDGLRFYQDFDMCGQVLWERYFHCEDLGRDLVPVVQDKTTVVPPPFNLDAWLCSNSAELAAGATLDLFTNHPDREFRVDMIGGVSEQHDRSEHDVWLHQVEYWEARDGTGRQGMATC